MTPRAVPPPRRPGSDQAAPTPSGEDGSILRLGHRNPEIIADSFPDPEFHDRGEPSDDIRRPRPKHDRTSDPVSTRCRGADRRDHGVDGRMAGRHPTGARRGHESPDRPGTTVHGRLRGMARRVRRPRADRGGRRCVDRRGRDRRRPQDREATGGPDRPARDPRLDLGRRSLATRALGDAGTRTSVTRRCRRRPRPPRGRRDDSGDPRCGCRASSSSHRTGRAHALRRRPTRPWRKRSGAARRDRRRGGRRSDASRGSRATRRR